MTVCAIISSVFVIILCANAFAESKFPERPIDLYVGFSAGGSTDTIARGLAAGAEKFLGNKILVVNKPGAGGAVAASQLVKSKPDGYTLQISPTHRSQGLPTLEILNLIP